jgi:hypothetical protein
VSDFCGSNRTCARALAAHNARRRNRYTTTAVAVKPPAAPPRSGAARRRREQRAAAARGEEDGAAWRELLEDCAERVVVDVSASASGGTDAEPTRSANDADADTRGGDDGAGTPPRAAPRVSAGDGSFLAFLDDILPLQPYSSSDALIMNQPPALLPPLHERYTSYFAPLVHSERMSLKLTDDAPLALPRSGLRPAVLRAFDTPPLALLGCVQPGW